jgi:uncharacterized membrane protein (DUF4010 family)
MAAVVVTVASSIVFLRVLLEFAAVAPQHFGRLAPPLAAYLVAFVALAWGVWVWQRRQQAPADAAGPDDGGRDGGRLDLGNPSELRSALVFGGLYALVLLAVAWARDQLGTGGLYAVAVLSGLTDMDAITLSTATMVEAGQIAASRGWRLVLVASMSNLVFKGVIVAVLGSATLGRRIALVFGVAVVAGGAILLAWPG